MRSRLSDSLSIANPLALFDTPEAAEKAASDLTNEKVLVSPVAGLYRGDEREALVRNLEESMRKLYAAYKQKVQGELQLRHYDKGALTLLAEIQRAHPSLSEND